MVRTEDACEIIKYALQNEIKVYLDGGWHLCFCIGQDQVIKQHTGAWVPLTS